MPVAQQISFQQLEYSLENSKEYIPRVVSDAATNVINFAKENNDNLMISVIFSMIAQLRSGMKSVSEIISIFSEKTETIDTPRRHQYISMMNEVLGENEEAAG